MTTYPLPTLSFQVTATGISAPPYSDIYTSFQVIFASIYGSDSYLDPDSQDGQMLAVVAKVINDVSQSAITLYNSYSPATGQGVGLSNSVKINGISRLVSSNSTSDVTIIGQAGTIITNGIIADVNNVNQWNLPASVTIPGGGSIVVTATCANPGAITAAANSLTQIITGTLGWQSVNNPAEAVPGAPVEDDAQLRVRQSVSTSLPAQTIIQAIYGALANIEGVQTLKIFENDTGTTDDHGIPGHTISVVIEGGDATTIAQTIEKKKNPGTGTYGTTTIVVTDPVGMTLPIHFYVPTQDTILVDIAINPLTGYTSTIGSEIIASIVSYINGLGIYGNAGLLSISSVLAAAYATSAPATYNVVIADLLIAISPGSPSNVDLVIPFNVIPVCAASNVTLVVT